jgi:prepilin-type N-terminal cleavage/methylation domain-containing protein
MKPPYDDLLADARAPIRASQESTGLGNPDDGSEVCGSFCVNTAISHAPSPSMHTGKAMIAKRNRRCLGFTLIELLVVITIIAVLASLVFSLAKHIKAGAQAAQSISSIRQCGMIALQKAAENNHFLWIHAYGPAVNMEDLRLYGMVQEATGLNTEDVGRLVYTPAYEKEKQALGPWPVWGVNCDDNLQIGVDWETVWVEREGEQRYHQGLRLAKCKEPHRYPLLADTSNSAGVPRSNFGTSREHKFAMRYKNKGPVFLLDGSCQLIGRAEMGRYGLTQAYLFNDNPISNPTLVTPGQ